MVYGNSQHFSIVNSVVSVIRKYAVFFTLDRVRLLHSEVPDRIYLQIRILPPIGHYKVRRIFLLFYAEPSVFRICQVKVRASRTRQGSSELHFEINGGTGGSL